jgi:hypothetical protein
MRSGNLGLMVSAALIAGGVIGCRHGNEDRDRTAASRTSSSYSRQEIDQNGRSTYTTAANRSDTDASSSKDMSGGGSTGVGAGTESSGSDSSFSAIELKGDAIVHFTAKSTDQNLSGMAAFTSVADGMKLVVDVNNAKPGRYAIVLREDGACELASDETSTGMSGGSGSRIGRDMGKSSNLDRDADFDTSGGYGIHGALGGSGSSDTRSLDDSGGAGTHSGRVGSPEKSMKKLVLGDLIVRTDGRGHFEQTLTKGQLDYRSIGSLDHQALVLRERSKSMTSNAGQSSEGVVACGLIIPQNKTPAS